MCGVSIAICTDSILFVQPQVSTDTTRRRPHVPPRHHTSSPAVTSQPSDVNPPIPKPRVRSVSPHKEASSKPVGITGVRVLPPISLSSSNPSPPQLPSYSNVPVVTTAAPVLPSYEAAISSQPPPPKPKTRTATNIDQYTLPDPTASLTPKELETVSQLASMGFPPPRVARATKHLKDSAKVICSFVLNYPVIKIVKGAGLLSNDR